MLNERRIHVQVVLTFTRVNEAQTSDDVAAEFRALGFDVASVRFDGREFIIEVG